MEIAAPWAPRTSGRSASTNRPTSSSSRARATQQRRIERRATRSWSVRAIPAERRPVHDAEHRADHAHAERLHRQHHAHGLARRCSGRRTPRARTTLARSSSSTSQGQQVTKSVAPTNVSRTRSRSPASATQRASPHRAGTFVGHGHAAALARQRGPGPTCRPGPRRARTAVIRRRPGQPDAWYRIGVKTGDYTSGTRELISLPGSIDGYLRASRLTARRWPTPRC
jgi:hypothetical protein